MKNKNLKVKGLVLFGFIILLALLLLLLLSGGNLEIIKSVFIVDYTNDQIQDKLSDLGFRGWITVVILSMLQVVIPFLPAEPVQVLAGLAFGFPVGLACCMIGVFLGNTFIFMLYKLLGDKIGEYFVKNLHFDLEKAACSTQLTLIIFIMYFLPAIPYGMICFLAVSMEMKYPRYIIVTILGSIPSVCIGVGLGHIALASSWIVSVAIFVVLVIIIAIITIKRKFIFDKINAYLDKPPYSSKTTVKKYKASSLNLPYIISKIVLFFKRIKVKYKNKIDGEIETPCIVLCNHGAFTDFVYAGTLLRKKAPNFIVARLYFYKKWFGKLLRRFGCFPKSMFTTDLESAKNCLRVLKFDGVLAMMPEARLSTVGRFEDIQEETYAFLKKAGVTVYSIKMSGDYLCSPKWGNGMRCGSYVEAELDILFTKSELLELSVQQIKERVDSRLSYNELEWLDEHPELEYRSKALAKGLENILTTCPECNSKFTLSTKGHDIFCEKCGKIATLDSRYSFTNATPFKNFVEWYDWQFEALREKIESNEDFSMSSEVTLKMQSIGGKGSLRVAGQGVCTLNKGGLIYEGTQDSENVTLTFPIDQIYRLLFGAGEDFEIYVGKEIYYFEPSERRSCVEWYIASIILVDNAKRLTLTNQ
ncbi:MAG: VTT domain-containing protein [Clostridia bacterium]|nr:VTT domain-containing protein [Clostridia bacterium]